MVEELAVELPGLALASAHRRSPQIRNRGTVGGNLGAASPAGDAHPALLAAFAEVELSSLDGVRRVPAHEFYTGPKKHAGRPDELVTAVWVRAATGPQQFSKIGTRNAMVIAVAAFGLALHPDRRASAPASARRRPPRAGRPTPRRSSRRSWTGSSGATCPPTSPPSSGGWSPPRRRRSTTCAAPRRTAGTPSPSWPGAASAGPGPTTAGGRLMRVTVTVNGGSARPTTSGRASLLYVLRERMGLAPRTPASRASAARARSTSTASPAARAWSRPGGPTAAASTPWRARRRGRRAAPVQQAYLDAGAVQCGFCTPGLLVATHDLLARDPDPDDSEIREALAGNLCRCTGYEKIIDAVHLAARRLR